MKKKIILILSMCALLVCLFVISASASSFSIYTDTEFTILSSDFQLNSVNFCYDSVNDFWLGQVLAYSTTSEYISGIIVINPFSFKSYLNSFNTLEDLHTYANDNYESSTSLTGYLASLTEDQFNYYRNYTEITQEDLTVQYNQGKTDGVTEYKESEEYSNVLSTQYNQGKTDGVAEFKDSKAYETVLAVERSIGASEGVANYLDSTEYADTLQAEYDKGYDDAESEKASNMLGTALGSIGIVVFVLLGVWLWLTLSKKKKRRR